MKYIALFILLFSYQLTISQEKKEITIKFENLKKIDVLKSIEAQTQYRFYFIENWLDDTLITGDYYNQSIKDILNIIFSKTDINYYISSDNKIFLTKNNLISDSLPSTFFKSTQKENKPTDSIITESIQYNENNIIQSDIIETIRIGKQNKNTNKKKYILSGYARNKNTNSLISNLIISVKGKNINFVTGSNGFYSIELPIGINLIEVKKLGLSSLEKRIIIYGDGVLNLYLTDDVEELSEVVIDASKDKNVKEAITGLTQIKTEEIKNIPLVLGERDILKVAITLPGIKTAGEGSSGFNVRGGKEDQNLILLDNGVIYNPTHFFGIFSALNPFTSGDVNIYKGTIPAEYGGRLSSVFEINTKNANDKKVSGEASIGPVTSNITIETPIIKNKSSILVGARGTYSDWILRSLDEESLQNSRASFYDIVAKYNHKVNEKNNIQTTGYFSKDQFSITSDSLFNYSNRLASLKWSHTFNDRNYGSLILSNSQYKFNIEFDGNSTNDFDLGYEVNETELKLKMNYLLNDKHKFDYGISGKLYNVDPGNIDPLGQQSIIESIEIPEERAFESGLFVSHNYNANEKLSLNLGIRYSFYAALGATNNSIQRVYTTGLPRNQTTLVGEESFSKNEVIETFGGPEFRISARYFLGEDFSAKASFNSSYQYIHTLSNNTTVSPTDTWKLSDSNIRPQQGNQYSLGFYKNLKNNTFEFSLEGYYKTSKNILDYKVGANLLLNQTIEAEVLQGDGLSYGIEFLLKKTKGRLNGWLGYSYSRSFVKLESDFAEEQINNGDFFASNFDKPHDVSLVLNYKLTKRFSFSGNFTYQTGRPVTFPVGSFILNGVERVNYSDRNAFRIPDFYRLDVGFNVEGNHKIKKLAHSFWNISIYNVLGRNNPYSVFFVTDNGDIRAFESSIFSIPIPTITYNLKF